MNFSSTMTMTMKQELPTSNTTVRSAILTSLQPIGSNQLFQSPVIETYPDLSEQYLQIVKEPICIREIKYKLNQKTIRYTTLYEVYHDLALLTYNCMTFSPNNDFLRVECQKFEQQLLMCINQFLFKLGVGPLTQYEHFKQAALCESAEKARDMAANILCEKPARTDNAVHFPAIENIVNQPDPFATMVDIPASPEGKQAFINELLKDFQALNQIQQECVLKNIVFEFSDLRFDEANKRAVLEFDLDSNPKQCLWFKRLIQEVSQQKSGDQSFVDEDITEQQ